MALSVYQSLWATEMRRPGAPERPVEDRFDRVRDAGFDPVVVGNLAEARRFQRGAPGYGQSVTAAELKQKLSLTP